jgi:hypothetical protein
MWRLYAVDGEGQIYAIMMIDRAKPAFIPDDEIGLYVGRMPPSSPDR